MSTENNQIEQEKYSRLFDESPLGRLIARQEEAARVANTPFGTQESITSSSAPIIDSRESAGVNSTPRTLPILPTTPIASSEEAESFLAEANEEASDRVNRIGRAAVSQQLQNLQQDIKAPTLKPATINPTLGGKNPLDDMLRSAFDMRKYVKDRTDEEALQRSQRSEELFRKALENRTSKGELISEADLEPYKIERPMDSGETLVEYNFGGDTVPQEVAHDYIATYNDERLHEKRFKEDDAYRNEWFLQHVGIPEQKYRNDLADYLDKELDKLEESLPPKVFVPKLASASSVAVQDKYEANARRKIGAAREKINTLRKNNFWSGLREGTDIASILTFDLSSIGDNLKLMKALDKEMNGEQLTKNEQALVDAWTIDQETEEAIEMLGGRSGGANIGYGVGYSLPYIPQLMATAGVGAAATKGISMAVAKAALKKSLATTANRKIAEGLKLGALKVAENAVGAAARAPFMGMTYKDFTNRRLEHYSLERIADGATGEVKKHISNEDASVLRDALLSYGTAASGVFSEGVGDWLSYGIKAAAKSLPRKNIIRAVAVDGITGPVKNPALIWLKRASKINGVLVEMAEEAIDDIATNVMTGDEDGWKQMATGQYWWELFCVSAILSGSFGAAYHGTNLFSPERKSRRALEKVRLRSLDGIKDGSLREYLLQASMVDDLSERSKRLANIDWESGYTREDMARAVDFITAQTMLDVEHYSAAEADRLNRMLPALKNINQAAHSKELSDAEIVQMLGDSYAQVFRTQENQQELNRIADRVRVAAEVGVSAQGINNILTAAGLKVYEPGDEVETLAGVRGMVNKVLPGAYEIIMDEQGNIGVFSFEEVLQPNKEVAEAQMANAGQEVAAEEQTEATEESQLDAVQQAVETAVETARAEVDKIKNQDDDIVYTVKIEGDDKNTGYIIKGAGLEVDSNGKIAKSDVGTVVVQVGDEKRTVAIDSVTVTDATSAEDYLRLAAETARGVAQGAMQAQQSAAQVPEDAAYVATLNDNTDVFVLKGQNIVYKDEENGQIDTEGSDQKIKVRYEDGTEGEVSPKDIDMLFTIEPAEATEAQTEVEQPAVEGEQEGVTDDQGNPINADGSLRIEAVESIDDITDEDFEAPFRNIRLPELPNNVSDAIGADGRSVVIKKNIFEKNGEAHVELSPEDNRNILRSALYSTNLVGSTQPIKRPDYKVAIQTGDMNSVVVLDVYRQKEYIEVVGWRMVNQRGLDKMKRQAEREGGQFLILSPVDGSAAALSALPLGLSSDNKNTTSEPKNQEVEQKNVVAPEIPTMKNGQPDYNAMTPEQFVEQYVTNYGEENTERIARNNIKEADKQIADLEKKMNAVTDPNKLPDLVQKQNEAKARKERYSTILNLLGVSEDANVTWQERAASTKKAETHRIAKLFPDGLPNVEGFILADIATGNRIRWSDKVVNGSVVSRGLGAELGLADANSERTRRISLLAKDAPTPEEYAEQLRERLDAVGIRYDENELRDKVLDVYASVDTVGGAWKALEALAENMNQQEDGLDYEEEMQRRAYERERQAEHPANEGEQVGRTDNQGNPINADGSLRVEAVESIDEITDEDFESPHRTIQIPQLPQNVNDAIGADGKPVIIKKNIFERNAISHSDLTPEQSRQILKAALYSTKVYGQNQKKRKPYNWVVISVQDESTPNKLVLLEVNEGKENVEIVHWHYIDRRGLEKLRRQAEREDGQLLILPSVNSEEVGALADPTLNLPSANKNTTSAPNNQEVEQKNVDDHGLIGEEPLSMDEDAPFSIAEETVSADSSSAAQLATEAAIVALEDAGIEVVEATPEMVEEALRRENVWRKIKRVLKTAEQSKTTIPTVISSTSGAKILKNLESEAKKYEEKPSNRSRTFIGDVSKALELEKLSGKSQYRTFETANGRIVTIRLSDHNATVTNFDSRNEDYGISIVVSGKANEGIHNSDNGRAHIVEFFYSEKNLRKAYGRPLARIIRSIKDALNSGEYVDETGLAERGEVNNPFSIESPSLVGLHNISEDKLRKALRMGGLVNPSVAVIDSGTQQHAGYGDITFVLPSSLVAQETGKNIGTYFGDAWTPTYPQVERKMRNDQASKDIASLPDQMRNTVRLALNSWLDGRAGDALAYMFLYERGDAPELQTIKAEYSQGLHDAILAITGGKEFYYLTPEQRQQVLDLYIQEEYNGSREEFDAHLKRVISRSEKFIAERGANSLIGKKAQEVIDTINEYGYDYDAVSRFVRDVLRDAETSGVVDAPYTALLAERKIKEGDLEQEYAKWVDSLIDRYAVEEVIFKGYTPSGDRKYAPNTLENASKEMREQGRAGATGFTVGFSRFAAKLLKPEGTLDAIRKRKGQLKTSYEEVEAFKDKWSAVLFDLAEKCQPGATGYEDYGFERLAEAATKKSPKAYLKKEYGVELSDEDAKRLDDMIKAIRTEYPVMYFETKFERPVYFNEFAGVVVPNDVSDDIAQALKNAGLPVVIYAANDEAARMKAVKEIADTSNKVMFNIGRAPVFVSNAKIAVLGISQEKATPEQWLKMIEKAGGLKAGEDKWIGLSEWLKASDKKTLTKQEVLDYINENQIQIEEVKYSEFGAGLIDQATKKLDAEMQAIGIDAMREKYPDFDNYFELFDGELVWSENNASEGEYEDYIIDNHILDVDPTQEGINETRINYTTEGLENKREIALTIPTIAPWNKSDVVHFGDAGDGRAIAWIRFGETTTPTDEAIAAKEAVDDYLASMREKYGSKEGEETDAMTADEINHLQSLTAKEIDSREKGLRVLVIDEIQSKRHQEGREHGYATDVTEEQVKKAREEADVAFRMLESFDEQMAQKYGTRFWSDQGTNEEYAHWELLRSEYDRYGRIYEELYDKRSKAIPAAPFEKNWAELAMKRMLRYAAENGYDAIAWTKGEQQAERYNIGSVVERITSYEDGGNRKVIIRLNNNEPLNLKVDSDGKIVSANREIGANTLSDVVGKELAVKIMNNEGEDATYYDGKDIPAKVIEGDGLRIGGEGMKGFYDDMLPRFMNKYGKKWGVKVSDITLPFVEKAGRTMHSVEVTDAMRESVMEGQPMFYRRPNGIVYGWTNGKTVYLTKEGMNPNTPIHEYTHIWAEAMMQNNRKGWDSIVKLIKGTPIWGEVMADPNYANIRTDEDKVAAEALSRISGKSNAAKMKQMAERVLAENDSDSVKRNSARKLIDRMRKALQEFWSWVGKELFGIEKFGSIDEVTDRVLYDLVSGTDLAAPADTSFLHKYDDAFAEIENEYHTLDKNNEQELKAWRVKKLELVKKYVTSISDKLAMPTTPIVFDSTDIESKKKAYGLLPEKYRNIGSLDEFVHDELSAVGMYLHDSNVSLYDISHNETLNSPREWLGVLAHENAHKVVEILGVSDSDKEKLWEFCKRTTVSVRKKIEEDYESAAERGEEYLVYTIQSRARYPRLGDLLAECIMGEKTAREVVESFKDSLPLRDEIVEKILNYFRDEYRKARGETDYSVAAGRAKSQEETQGFYDRLRSRYRQGLRRDNSIGRDLDANYFSIGDNAETEESADIEVGEGATLEPGVNPESEKAQKALQRLNKVVRQFRAKLNKVSKENLDWGQSVAAALESEVGSGELLSFLEMSDFISNIRGAISEKSVDKALEALSDKVLTKLIAERRKNLDKLLKVEVQRTTPAGIPIAHGVDNATRQVVDTFNAIKRLGAEQVRKYMEDISDKDMPGHLKAEVMQLHTLWALIQDAEVHLEVLEQKKTRAHEESVAWYRTARELKGVKGKEKEREKALAARRTHLAEIRRIEPLLTETKQQLADDYASLVEQFADRIMVGRAAQKRKINEEREYARRFGIEAWKDVETGRDRRTYEYSAEEKMEKKKDQRIRDIRLSMYGSLKYMIESVSINAIGGRGFIYREMIEGDNGWVACRDNELKMNLDCDIEILERTKKAGFKTVDDMRRAFDERLLMSDGTQAVVTYKTERTGSVKEEKVPLTVGNATYLVLMWNQPDIRPTLEKMNIDEGTIMEINEMLPAYAKNFIEWSVDMLEQRLEKVYSPASVQMYGTSMDKNLNYFPVRRVKEDTYHAPVDITDPNAIPDDNKKVVNTSTALIRRKANLVSVEILVNPMEVLGKHLEEMNHFAAFVPFARNANILLSAPGFREQLDMQEGRGHGLNTYDNFKRAVLVAAGNYQPKTGDIDRIMCEVQGMIAAGKISWRFFTAAKQILSLPAFASYTTDRKYWGILAKNILTTAWWKRGESGRMATWRWCYENLPTFRERWDSKYAGDEKLSTIEATAMARALDRSMAGRAIRDFFGKYGMLANAAVDAFTCSIGAYSIYEYELQRYQKEEGMSKEEADKMAKRRAEIGFNQSQQSSELMFLAPSQLDRTFAATYASLFENSNRAYGRIERVAGEQIVRSFNKEAVKKQLDLASQRYAKKMRDAERARLRAENEKISDFSQRLSEEQIEEVVNTKRGEFDIEARKKAEADMARAKKNAVSDVVVFRYLLNTLWGIAPSLALSVAFIGGDDDDKNPESWDWKFWAMRLLQARLRNGVGGATIESIMNGFGVQSMLESDLNKIADTASETIANSVEAGAVDWQGLWVTAKLVFSMGVGVNIDTFISMYNAVCMVINDGSLDAEDVALFLNAPKNIIEMAAIRPDEGESQEDYIKRIAFMKGLAENVEAARKKQEMNREGIVEELTDTDKSALTNLKKWQKNYIDIKTARALGLKWERNRYNGRVEIPELKALDEKYNEMLDSLNLTQGLAKKAKEKRYLYPEAVQRKMNADKERLSVMKRLRNIQGLEKGRELNVVKNSDYEALTRQWYDAKRSLVEDWYNR